MDNFANPKTVFAVWNMYIGYFLFWMYLTQTGSNSMQEVLFQFSLGRFFLCSDFSVFFLKLHWALCRIFPILEVVKWMTEIICIQWCTNDAVVIDSLLIVKAVACFEVFCFIYSLFMFCRFIWIDWSLLSII